MSLRCIGINKSFGANRALSNTKLIVRRGSIHALLGENGAGKSTLNKIISGVLKPDSGCIEMDGKTVALNSALDAARLGIGMVHQHFLLAEALSVAENIALGTRQSFGGWHFDRKKVSAQIDALAQRTGLAVDPNARVSTLPVGVRQRVEILKALSRGAQVLLLDEPTAVLAPAEIERLFQTLRALRDEGRTIIIVTHKLDEVYALAEDVTVLRKGVTVHEGALKDIGSRDLTRAMIGQDPPHLLNDSVSAKESQDACTTKLFELRGALVPGILEVAALTIHAGEIAGVAGVEGNGQAELADLISGMLEAPFSLETLKLGELDLKPLNIRARSAAGIASIPADRQREGLVLDLTLWENMYLRQPLEHRVGWVNMLDLDDMRTHTKSRLEDFSATPSNPDLKARALSGGNQQKAIAARELSARPKLILACHPTRGLDVGAAAEIQNRLIQAARHDGAAVLLISADLDEVLAVSDRVYALHRGKLIDAGPRGVSREIVGRAMLGAEEVAA